MSLHIANLTKSYGQTIAVNNVTLLARPGEVLGFLGPNGAGKSTTMKVATGYLSADAGKVEVAGYDVTTQSAHAKKALGYLPEHNPLYLDMYVREYLAFTGNTYGLQGKLLRATIEKVIEQTGIGAMAAKKIGSLSKGYRQRVGLAQVLVHDPAVLILDEPTTGLDPNQILEIRSLIKSLGRDKTVILSTHLLQEVEAICDTYIIINKGRITAEGRVKGDAAVGMHRLELDRQADIVILRSLDGIAACTQRDDRPIYSLTLNDERVGRTAIVQYAAAQGFDIISLAKERQDLEYIFSQATNS